MLYSINKLSKLLKTKTLITIYNNICLPHLTYGNYIWGKKYQEHTDNLFISTNKKNKLNST